MSGNGSGYGAIDGQGGTLALDVYTARGFLSFAPWDQLIFSNSIAQLNLGYIPISKADTFYAGSIVNTTTGQFHYNYSWSNNESSYIGDQYHITVNQPSSLNSVGVYAFLYQARSARNPAVIPLSSAAVQSVSLPSVSNKKSSKISTNTTANSTPTLTKNPTDLSTKTSTTSTPTMTPSLSESPHLGADGQGGVTYRDQYTGRGYLSFTPWSNPLEGYSIGQINLGYLPISKADTYYSGSTVNVSRNQFRYYYGWFSEQATSYLANQFHITANQPSAVSSVAFESFRYIDNVTTQARSVPNPAIKTAPTLTRLIHRTINKLDHPYNQQFDPLLGRTPPRGG